MSHLHDILNPDAARKQPAILAVETEFEEQMSSSFEEDDDIIDMSPISDEEIDELDDDSLGEDDYREASPPTSPRLQHPLDGSPEHTTQEIGFERAADRNMQKNEEKRPQKQPRRKLERHDRKIDLGLHDHKAHADCPDTLACLPDTAGRPQHTLPVILRCAILGSPRKRLTIREIYATMESKYPFYKTAGLTWKQSVRHHLSLNRLFERQPRPVTDPGFGSYWTVNLSAPPGTKRPRKRGRPNKDNSDGASAKKSSINHQRESSEPQPLTPGQSPPVTKFQFQPQTHPPPPPPPLPQPQINSLNPRPSNPHHQVSNHQMLPHGRHHDSQHPHYSSSTPHNQSYSQPRPQLQHHHSFSHPHQAPSHHQSQPRSSGPYTHSHREGEMQRSFHHYQKPSTPITPASGRDSDYPPSSRDSDLDDSSLLTMEEDRAHIATVSEDECESEEDMVRPYNRRSSLPTTFVPSRLPPPIPSLPPFSSLDQTKEDVIEHMRQEIATLRRTSAEAVSTSIRLSEQLANANLEVSRSREVVRDLEDMLQDEAKKRKDAERQKEMEAERRRAAELALNNIALRSPNRPRPT